jgi:hypothetical protein
VEDKARALCMTGVGVLKVIDASPIHRRRSPYDTVNLVSLLQQELSQI